MKTLARRVCHRLADSSLPVWINRFVSPRRDRRMNLLRVLTYHRVAPAGERPELDPGLVSCSPEEFRTQIAMLREDYNVVSLQQVQAAFRAETTLPARSVLITFDDACIDFAEHAWPILKTHGVPVTLFVPTGFPDHPDRAFWWDRLYHAIQTAADGNSCDAFERQWRLVSETDRRMCYRELKQIVKSRPHGEASDLVDRIVDQLDGGTVPNPVLGWERLGELRNQGVTLAPHTRTHPMLNRLSVEYLRDEIGGSLDDLRSRFPETPPVLAYPGGGVDRNAEEATREAGIALAFTTRRGVNDVATQTPRRLRRINVGQRTTLPLLRLQLTPTFRHGNRWLK